ncbi:hypothetical protein AB0L41_25645 [Amycolatopsis mediterranei]|uniref:hypothetical protein n=1 Tax=Amycolatopsis mediterranei TaxID=33910 RepID=UPI00341E617E
MPQVGDDDVFETKYMAKLEAAVADHGLAIKYGKDRAAFDLGLHLYNTTDDGKRGVGPARIWMQCKGIKESTLSAEAAKKTGSVAVKGLSTDHIAYWYAAPEPVYLVVYVEALDIFLAQDVRDLLDQRGRSFNLQTLATSQQTTTLHIDLNRTLDKAIQVMPQHRSMRIDGAEFRGRPLGHNFDPLRSELAVLPPDTFTELVTELLAVHDFRAGQRLDAQAILGDSFAETTIVEGRLTLTYEWTSPLFTEFGYDEGSDFRIESPPEHAQGDVVVIVHPGSFCAIERKPQLTGQLEQWKRDGRKRILVFFNDTEDPGQLGEWRVNLAPLCDVPQGLGSLSFNVLTTTNVYLRFLDKLSWRYVNYLH